MEMFISLGRKSKITNFPCRYIFEPPFWSLRLRLTLASVVGKRLVNSVLLDGHNGLQAARYLASISGLLQRWPCYLQHASMVPFLPFPTQNVHMCTGGRGALAPDRLPTQAVKYLLFAWKEMGPRRMLRVGAAVKEDVCQTWCRPIPPAPRPSFTTMVCPF